MNIQADNWGVYMRKTRRQFLDRLRKAHPDNSLASSLLLCLPPELWGRLLGFEQPAKVLEGTKEKYGLKNYEVEYLKTCASILRECALPMLVSQERCFQENPEEVGAILED